MRIIDAVVSHQGALRLGAFVGIFSAMALWEILAPRRPRQHSRSLRWSSNLALIVIDAALLRIVLPTTAIGLALFASDRGWGLLNWAGWPLWATVPISVLLLDLTIYGQHVAFHAIAPLWRLHRMHHADLDFDVSTGVRFHPIEILLSTLIKFAVVVALGVPAVAILVFEIILNGTSMFNHGNVRLPEPLDRVLRWIVVTPEMHRVHHSIIPHETNSNFGFNLPWWDWLFDTYVSQPVKGHLGMTIGIDRFRDPLELQLPRMLLQPFRSDSGMLPPGMVDTRT